MIEKTKRQRKWLINVSRGEHHHCCQASNLGDVAILAPVLNKEGLPSATHYYPTYPYTIIRSKITTTFSNAVGLSGMRLSGLQRDVLSLYRKCLRETRKKPAVCS